MNDDIEGPLKSVKCAKALFSICLLMLVAIWLLNNSIADYNARRNADEAHYDLAQNRLGKLKALQNKNADFFEDLTWSAISRRWNKFREPVYDLIDGRVTMWTNLKQEPHEFSDAKFQHAVSQFSSSAAKIISTNIIPEKRFELLCVAATNIFFSKTNNLNMAKTYVFNSIEGGLDTNVLRSLSLIDDKSQWRGLVGWLVFSYWPPGGWNSAYNDGRGSVSFTDRFPGKWSSYAEEWDTYYQIAASDTTNAEFILRDDWKKARDDAKSSSPAPSQVGIAGTDLSLNVADLLMVGGPILIFCQGLYLIFRKKERLENPEACEETRKTFEFPQFSCPTDALTAPPTTFVKFLERGMWLLFLTLPSLLLAFGILTRFDVVTAGESFRRVPWLQSALLTKRPEFASNLLDVLNLVCFLISFRILIEISRPTARKPTFLGGKVSGRILSSAVMGFFGLLFVYAFFTCWDRGALSHYVWPQALLLVTFVIGLAGCFAIALRTRSLTGVALSVGLLVIMLFLAT